MYASRTELDELHEMRANIRRGVDALELCWSCQRIAACEQTVVDDAAPVWLCRDCHAKRLAAAPPKPGTLFWPSPWEPGSRLLPPASSPAGSRVA